MKVLSLFDYTGIMLEPWRDAGYQCYLVDIQHAPGMVEKNGMYCLGMDLSEFPTIFKDEKFDFISAFPPCDHLAVSGARWFKGKGLRLLSKAIQLFATATEICETNACPYMIENPVSTISTYWRKPDYTFHPYQYTLECPEDNYRKKTCLWVGNGFIMPHIMRDYGAGLPDNRIHNAPPGAGRKNFRSATPRGFAKAVFEVNRKF